MLFAERGTARRTLVHVRLCHTCRMRSRINVPAHTAACSACGDIVFPRACTVRGNYTLVSHPPVRPLVRSTELVYVRVCVHDLGGRGSNGRAWPVQQARASIACDDGRWQRRADLGRENCCFICLRRLNLRIPEQCARGGPTATADGDRMHARTRNTDHAPCSMRQARPTSDAQQTSCRRCAGWHSGVLKGNQHHSAAGR